MKLSPRQASSVAQRTKAGVGLRSHRMPLAATTFLISPQFRGGTAHGPGTRRRQETVVSVVLMTSGHVKWRPHSGSWRATNRRGLEQPQDVVEDRMPRQLGRRTSAPACEVRQDKMLELLETQTRRDALPSLGLRHVDRQSGRILVVSVDSPTIQHSRGLQPTSNESKTSNQSHEPERLRARCEGLRDVIRSNDAIDCGYSRSYFTLFRCPSSRGCSAAPEEVAIVRHGSVRSLF